MIPKFLQPERIPYASVEIVHIDEQARLKRIAHAVLDDFHTFLTDPATGPKLDALLVEPAAVDDGAHDGPACGPSCCHPYLTDPTARDLDVDARDEDRGSTCGANCGYCGGCS